MLPVRQPDPPEGLRADFQYADYYLRQVADELKGHDLPTLVGTFISDNRAGLLERSVLHADQGWLGGAAGVCFYSDRWERQLADGSEEAVAGS